MTIIEAVSLIDDRKHNTFTQEDKVAWLSRLDGLIHAGLFGAYQQPPPPFTPYSVDTDVETVLLVPPPFDGVYLHYLEMQIDYHSGDFVRCNNARLLFTSLLNQFEAYYHRTRRPKKSGDFRMEGLCAGLL